MFRGSGQTYIMDTSTLKTNKMLFAFCGVMFALPCLFFTYYTVRLAYVNLAMSAEDAATHRTGGMLIGAVAFPLAAIIFGLILFDGRAPAAGVIRYMGAINCYFRISD